MQKTVKRSISPYFPTNVGSFSEGFSFIGDGYPTFEGDSCISKVESWKPNPTKKNIKTSSTNRDGFITANQANYNALFLRPSLDEERMQDLREIIVVDNAFYLVGTITLVSLLIGGIFLASYNKK